MHWWMISVPLTKAGCRQGPGIRAKTCRKTSRVEVRRTCICSVVSYPKRCTWICCCHSLSSSCGWKWIGGVYLKALVRWRLDSTVGYESWPGIMSLEMWLAWGGINIGLNLEFLWKVLKSSVKRTDNILFYRYHQMCDRITANTRL